MRAAQFQMRPQQAYYPTQDTGITGMMETMMPMIMMIMMMAIIMPMMKGVTAQV